MSDELAFATVAQLAPRISRKDLSSLELVTALIERTTASDANLNSYITFLPEQALEQAKRSDQQLAQGKYLGPLHGIPISIKDHIETAGIRTSMGAKSLLSNVPQRDARLVGRLRTAGAIVIGKANMNRFAGGDTGDNAAFGRIRNPWNPEFSAGGSSGGSACMVAAGFVPVSIGTDNGGSIRIPAALCGVVGLKPTFGRVSLEGIFPRAYTFDHAGPLTRSAEDAALVLNVIAGHDSGDTTTARKPVPDYRSTLQLSVKALRVGVDRQFASAADPEVVTGMEQALETLVSLGARVREVTLPAVDEFLAIGYALSPEFSVGSADLFRQYPSEFPPDDVGWQIAGELVPAVDYIRATQKRRVLQQQFAVATREVDVLVSPPYAFARRPFGALPMLRGKQATFDDVLRFPWPFDLLGVPSVSVPCGFTSDGHPLGVHIAGRAFDEATVLRVAHALEQATEWHKRHPPL